MNFVTKDFPLIFQGTPYVNQSVLTMENCNKWYDIHLVTKKGEVKVLPYFYNKKYEDETKTVAWSNHVPTPWFCKWLVDNYKEFVWDTNSYLQIIGAWVVLYKTTFKKGDLIFENY